MSLGLFLGVFLNIDLGELPDEPEVLYRLAQVANIALGGHAGDETSIATARARCAAGGARVGAHPSYPDRAGFGRRQLEMSALELAESVAEQCARLPDALSLKPHGALYHAADADAALAAAVLDGAAVLGRPDGDRARRRGARGGRSRPGLALRPRGLRQSRLPRARPGPLRAPSARPARRAPRRRRRPRAGEGAPRRRSRTSTPSASTATRPTPSPSPPPSASSSMPVRLGDGEPLGEGALRFRLPAGVDPPALLATLRAQPGVVDAVVTDAWAAVTFADEPPPQLASGELELVALPPPRTHIVPVRYDGPDLADVAAHAGLSPDEVVRIHAGGTYRVLFVGFAPGSLIWAGSTGASPARGAARRASASRRARWQSATPTPRSTRRCRREAGTSSAPRPSLRAGSPPATSSGSCRHDPRPGPPLRRRRRAAGAHARGRRARRCARARAPRGRQRRRRPRLGRARRRVLGAARADRRRHRGDGRRPRDHRR